MCVWRNSKLEMHSYMPKCRQQSPLLSLEPLQPLYLLWKKETDINKAQEERRQRSGYILLSLITVLAMATAKDEQEQTEEMQNIKGQNKETYSWLCILKYLLHFNMLQMSNSSEEKVSWEASAHTYGRHELRGHYEKVLFVKNNHNLSYLGPEILQGFQHNHEVMPDSPLWRTTWAEEMFLWAGTVCQHMAPV